MKHKALAVVMALAVIIAFGGCWNDPTEGIDETAQGGNQAAETQPTDQPQDAKQPADVAKIVFDIPEGWEYNVEGTAARPIITLADIPNDIKDKEAALERSRELGGYAVGITAFYPGDEADFQQTVEQVINYIGGKDKINQPPDEDGRYTTMEDIEIAGYKAVLFQSYPYTDIIHGGTDIVFMKDGNIGWLGSSSKYAEQKANIENVIKTIHRE